MQVFSKKEIDENIEFLENEYKNLGYKDWSIIWAKAVSCSLFIPSKYENNLIENQYNH